MGRHSKLRSIATAAREERAQGVLEFALISMVLLLIFAGTVDFSRVLYYQTAINNAARVGTEVAITPCSNSFTCGRDLLATDDFVMQAATCATGPTVTLSPQISCTNCITSGTTCTNGPCSTTCTNCAQDVCVVRSPSGSPADQQQVTVDVGYNFVPVAPIINQFFTRKACYSGDTTAHTICAQAVGRVF